MLIKKAIEGYLIDISTNYSTGTIRLYKLYLGKLNDFFPSKFVNDISESELKEYFIYLQKHYKPNRPNGDTTPLSPAALDNHWKCIRSFFGWCSRELKISRPDLNLKRPNFSKKIIQRFTKDEIKTLVLSTKYTKEAKSKSRDTFKMIHPTEIRDKLIILILLDTGIRISELCRLKVMDINLSTGEIVIHPYGTGKKTKGRTVFIGKITKKILWKHLTNDEIDTYHDKLIFNISPASIRSLLHRLGTKVKIHNVHPHRFRHTFAIQYLRNGGDLFTLQRLLGNSTLSMVNNY